MGHVRSIGPDEIVLDDGVIPTNRAEVHVDCTAAGLRLTAGRPIFERGRITLQQVRVCQPTFNAALIGYVEATREGEEKNALCPPNPYPNTPADWIPATMVTQRALAAWLRDSDLMAWLEESRPQRRPRHREADGRSSDAVGADAHDDEHGACDREPRVVARIRVTSRRRRARRDGTTPNRILRLWSFGG